MRYELFEGNWIDKSEKLVSLGEKLIEQAKIQKRVTKTIEESVDKAISRDNWNRHKHEPAYREQWEKILNSRE